MASDLDRLLARALQQGPQNTITPQPQTLMDTAAMATSPIPGVGDLAGLLADANAMRKNPSWGGALAMALGALPLVPSPSAAKRVVYHASHRPADFSVNKKDNPLIYFSDKPRNTEFGKYTTEATLDFKNPLDIEHFSMDWRDADNILAKTPKDKIKKIVDKAAEMEGSIADELESTGDYYETLHNWLSGELSSPNPPPVPYTDLLPEIKKAGYDGIIGTDPFGGSREYIAFDTKQISAKPSVKNPK